MGLPLPAWKAVLEEAQPVHTWPPVTQDATQEGGSGAPSAQAPASACLASLEVKVKGIKTKEPKGHQILKQERSQSSPYHR